MFALREEADQDAVMAAAEQALSDAEELLQNDKTRMLDHEDAGWDKESLRSPADANTKRDAT